MTDLGRIGVLLVIVAALAGCGGSAGSSSSASTATAASASSSVSARLPARGPSLPRIVAFAKCMRAHGVPDFPDEPTRPPATNGTQPAPAGNGGINPTAPAYQTASKDCHSLAPATKVSQTQSDQMMEAQLKFAACMRTNGVPDYPDPSSNGTGTDNAGVNLAAPAVQRAERVCSSLITRILPPPPGGG